MQNGVETMQDTYGKVSNQTAITTKCLQSNTDRVMLMPDESTKIDDCGW